MKKRTIVTSAAAMAVIYFTGAATGAEPTHIADFIRYEVKVVKMVPGTPDEGVDMAHVAKLHEEYVELLVESANEKLQLAYIKLSIAGTLEMVPFDDWDVTLGAVRKEIEEFAPGGVKEPTLEDYVRLRTQLSVVYADIFKKEYGMSFTPKVERILSRIEN